MIRRRRKNFAFRTARRFAGLGYLAFDEADFNPTPGTNGSFSLSSFGDEVYLLSGDANTNLTGYAHGFSFGGVRTGDSFGRYLNSVGEEQFPAQIANTFGATNAGPLVADIVINEIHYHPAPGGDEFIELHNRRADANLLLYARGTTNTWKVDGVGFTFPTNAIIPTNGYVLLVATNPADFRANIQRAGERAHLRAVYRFVAGQRRATVVAQARRRNEWNGALHRR